MNDEDKDQSSSSQSDEDYKIHFHGNMSAKAMENIVRMIKWVQQIEPKTCPNCGARYAHGMDLKDKRLVCACEWEGPNDRLE